jgi:hypothetical protein
MQHAPPGMRACATRPIIARHRRRAKGSRLQSLRHPGVHDEGDSALVVYVQAIAVAEAVKDELAA